MIWKKIPGCEDYFICSKGLVLRGKYITHSEPPLDKAILPSMQGKRCYVRIRSKGSEKKLQLLHILHSLFPELFEDDLCIETKNGPLVFNKADLKKAHFLTASENSSEHPVAFDDSTHSVFNEEQPDNASFNSLDFNVNSNGASTLTIKLCKSCNREKSLQSFTAKGDMCNECFSARDKLLSDYVKKYSEMKRSMKDMYHIIEDMDGDIEY